MLLANGIALQGPVVAHCVEIQLVDEFRDIGPVHALAMLMEVERNVGEVGSIEIVDKLAKPVRDRSLSAMLFRQVDDGLM